MQTTPIAENHVTITRALFNEGMHAIGKKGYLKGMRNLTILLVLAYILIAVWTFYNNGSPFMLIGETFTLTVLLLWMFIFLPRSKLKTKYKIMSQNGLVTPSRIIRFYEDSFTVTNGSGKMTNISYKKVSEWQETKNLYILHCDKNTWVLLSKEGFTFGSFDVVKPKLPR